VNTASSSRPEREHHHADLRRARCRAKANGWCWKPGNCPGGVYYYGGLDLVTSPPIGCKVHPAFAGNISKIYSPPNAYGWGAKIKHDYGYETIYAHLSAVEIDLGEYVTPNDIIGYTGWTGNVWDAQEINLPLPLIFTSRRDTTASLRRRALFD